MAWPTIGEYNAAFANPGANLLPPSLQGARTKLGPLGTPMPLSGGFALIYEVTLPSGSRKAVRCFTEDVPVRRARAAAACIQLGKTISSFPSLRSYFAVSTWEEKCIRAGANIVPAMVMDWVEGQTLGQYLEAKHSDTPAIESLREKLALMVRELERFGIVHGDLQTGNIIVNKQGEVTLLDYDGISFAGVESGADLESGHVNFQHPAWSRTSQESFKDRFPAITIDLGLAALSEQPSLFARFSTGENILFVRDDFCAPDESAAVDAIRDIPSLAQSAELLTGLCHGSVENIPKLDEFRTEAYKKEARQPAATVASSEPYVESKPAAQKMPKKGKGPYAGPYPVFDGFDFKGISGVVGKKIEVVGRIISVKADGITKYGKPFVFVNFGDWRRDGFKLTIWSEGLDTFSEEPSESWVGRYVSAVGLIDEPYHGKRSYTTQLSITIQDSSQVRLIDENEAKYRLGGPPPRKESEQISSNEDEAFDWDTESYAQPTGRNTDLLAGLGSANNDKPSTQPTMAAKQPLSAKASNSELLSQLNSGTSIKPQSTWQKPLPTQASPPQKTSNESSGGSNVIKAIAWIIGLFILLKMLGVF